MTPQEIKRIAPHASQSCIDANSSTSGPIVKPAVHNGTNGKAKRKKEDPGRCAVRVTSYRKRAIDPDNLCAKYFIDALRYAGVLHDDRAEDIIYQIGQKKVDSENEEKTLIALSYGI